MGRLTLAFAGMLILTLLPAGTANAVSFRDPGLRAPALTEQVVCRIVRERVVRPNGRVIHRVRRICGPPFGHRRHRVHHCRIVRERIVRPSGIVVFRSVRRCR
jgi:hypothetical protein